MSVTEGAVQRGAADACKLQEASNHKTTGQEGFFPEQVAAGLQQERAQPQRTPRGSPVQAPRKAPEVPEPFFCPITLEMMQDPVSASDGHSYERRDIQAWLLQKETSPLTNEKISSDVRANRNLKKLIDLWNDEQGKCQAEASIMTEAAPAEESSMAANMTPLHIASPHRRLQDIPPMPASGGPAVIGLAETVSILTALHAAIRRGDACTIAQLLQASPSPAAIINVQCEGKTALMRAAHLGYIKIVDQLLKVPGCEITARQHCNFAADVYICRHPESQHFLELHSENFTALGYAAKQGHARVVRRLLKALKPDELHAALCEHSGMSTPLSWAASRGSNEAVKQLLSIPAGLLAISIPSSWDGKAALHYAAERGHAGIVAQLLLASSSPAAIINVQDNAGYTALMLAAGNGHVSVVEEILKHPGCSKDACFKGKWYEGRTTALSIAKKHGNRHIIRLLR